jgi:hypothetical protein
MRTCTIVGLAFIACFECQAQQGGGLLPYPSAKEVRPVVHSFVSKIDSTYTYTYLVSNGSNALQSIAGIFIPIGGLSIVGCQQGEYWHAGIPKIKSTRTFAWGSVDSAGLLYPGGATQAFGLQTTGIPRIRAFYFHGQLPPDTLNEEPEYDMTGSDLLTNSYQLLSVGSALAPHPINPLLFADSLTAMIQTSKSQNWISNDQTAAYYLSRVSTMRSSILATDIQTAKSQADSIIFRTVQDSLSLISSEAYALVRFNTEYLKKSLNASNEVRAGVLSTPPGSLSVKAKPSMSLMSSDSIIRCTVTLRWLTGSSIVLGTVSSPVYGFSKLDPPVTVGSYTYQKFRTTLHKSIPWVAGTEYELFTVPINNPTGLEQIELTNALAGGEWFIDINYLDKTDSTFYQPIAQGFVYSNKADNGGATAYNHARHIAVSGTKFHELFGNQGEIIYRRKDLSTGNWEVTSRISSGNGGNNDGNIIVAANGYLFAVWQHFITSSTLNVSWARSTDGGTTWTSYPILGNTGTVTVSSSQLNTFPVVAQYSTTQILVVYCTTNGLFFVKSLDNGATWSTPAQVPTVGTLSSIWFPSIAKGTNYLILTYDTRSTGVYSTKYNGTSWWSTAANISSGIGTIYDRYSSIVVDASNVPMAAWCAQRNGRSEYRIVFRLANVGGDTWSSTYTEFTQRPGGISDYYPSMNAFQAPGNLSYREVLWHSSNNQVGLQQWTMGNWTASNLSTTGLWASTAAGSSVRVWTDQSASPYEVKRSSMDGTLQLQAIIAGASSVQNERRVTLESESSGSFLSFELTPLTIVSSEGDTTELSFKAIDQASAITLTESQSWDYIGTDNVVLPANAKYLVFDAEIQNVTRQDSTSKKSYSNPFTNKTFTVSVVKGGQKTQVYSDNTAQSGRKTIDISAFAGQTVAIRPAGTATRKAGEVITVGVGNIYAPRK